MVGKGATVPRGERLESHSRCRRDATTALEPGAMVRGVTAVRVDPLPAGYEDFDHKNDGWPLVYQDSVIVYGHGISR